MILAAIALALAPPPPPEPPREVRLRPWSAEVAIRDGSASCGECSPTRGRFVVAYEHHYGFSLRTEGYLDNIIWIVFAKPEVSQQFERFYRPENLRTIIGKRVYCDCSGVRYDVAGGGAVFRISEARLFADR